MSHSTASSRIAVLGGGIPGLVTAYRLAKLLDAEITLIEADETLGGESLWFGRDGEFIDSRPRIWTSDDQDLLDFFGAAGVDIRMDWKENQFGFLAGGVRHPFSTRSEWKGCGFTGALYRMPLFFAHGSVRKPPKGEGPWEMSAERWLKSIFGSAITKKLILPLLKSRFGGAALDLSAGTVHDWLRTTATQTPHGILETGTKPLIDSLEKLLLELGVKISKSEKITGLRNSGEGGIVVASSLDESQPFDTVVSTLSPVALAGISEPDLIEGFNVNSSAFYRGAVCAACFLNKPLGDGGRTSLLGPDAEFDEIYEVPGTRGEKAQHLVYLTRYCRSDSDLFDEKEALIAGRWAQQLCELHAGDGISSSDIAAVTISKFPRVEPVRGTDYGESGPKVNVGGRPLFLVHPELISSSAPHGNAIKKLAFDVAEQVALNVRGQEIEKKIGSALGRR